MKSYAIDLLKQLGLFGSKAIFLGVGLIVVLLISIGLLDRYLTMNQPRHTMTVVGVASKDVVPDQAMLSVGIEHRGDDPIAMQDKGIEIVNTALQRFKDLGIPEENITTSSFEFRPAYSYETEQPGSIVLAISMSLKIKGINEDSTTVGKALRAAFDAGLNRINSLSYLVADQKEIEEELKEQALENARKDKEFLEAKTGVRLGAIRRIDLGNDYYTPYLYRSLDKMESYSTADAAPTLEVQIGTQEISKRVVVEYEILW